MTTQLVSERLILRALSDIRPEDIVGKTVSVPFYTDTGLNYLKLHKVKNDGDGSGHHWAIEVKI